MEDKLISIIIPTYNREKEVLECLSSLTKIEYKNYEIIVIDNASSDNTVKSVREHFPKVKIIKFKENKGAVGGRNEGIKHAVGDYLCFVDSDNIVDKKFLSELVKLAEADTSIGFVGPKMYYYKEPNRIWFAGVKINLLTSRTTYIGLNEIDEGQYDYVKETTQIPNVWLVKRDVIDKIGLMDEVYVMSYGESDWPMRANKAGYKIMFCPTSIVFHNTEVSSSTNNTIMVRGSHYRIYYMARNRTIFMKKFASPLNFLIFILFFNNLFLIAYLFTFVKYKRYDLTKNYIRGYFDGLRLIKTTRRI